MSSDEKHQKVWNKLREIHEEYHSPQKNLENGYCYPIIIILQMLEK